MFRSTLPRLSPVNPSVINLRVGRILECKHHENADKLYVSQIKIGEEKSVQVCSGLVGYIPQESMVDRKVVVVTNLKASKMRGVKSEAMLLAAEVSGKVDLVSTPESAKIGEVLSFEGFEATEAPKLKSKVWEELAKKLRTNENGEVIFRDERDHVLRGESGVIVSSLPNAMVR